MKSKLDGKDWEILFEKCRGCYGWCCHSRRVICIDPKHKDEKEALDTLIHEAIHAMFPWMDEEKVAQSATELAKLLAKVYEFS
jgi:hypothetical protein